MDKFREKMTVNDLKSKQNIYLLNKIKTKYIFTKTTKDRISQNPCPPNQLKL